MVPGNRGQQPAKKPQTQAPVKEQAVQNTAAAQAPQAAQPAQNVAQKLSVVDGVCVGTAFKKDGKFENQVELQRVVEFMDAVRAYRATK